MKNKNRSSQDNLLVVLGVLCFNHLVGLVVKASASRAEGPGSNPASTGIFPGRVIPVT